MSATNFDPANFLNTEIEGVGETEYTAIPEGEYQGVIKEVKANATEKGQAFLEVYWIIDDQSVRELLDQDEPVSRQTLWLDLNENGGLAFGKNKNIQLNRVREALGQNDGKPWKPGDMVGQPATVTIKHRLLDTGATFAQVSSVRA